MDGEMPDYLLAKDLILQVSFPGTYEVVTLHGISMTFKLG